MKIIFTLIFTLAGIYFAIATTDNNINVRVHYNIVFGEAINDRNISQPLRMDIYLTDSLPKVKRPVAVFVHGGGFKAGDKQQDMYIRMCREFAEEGYVSLAVNYRLTRQEKVTLPVLNNAVDDVLSAIRWIRTHHDEYAIDTTKVIIIGDSAGGGIVVNTAYSDEGRQLIACCIDLWGGLPFSQNEPDINQYGQPVNYNPIQSDAPPTCIFHSDGDAVIPVSTSLNLADELKTKGITHEIHILDSPDHYPEYLADQFIPLMIDFANRIIGK